MSHVMTPEELLSRDEALIERLIPWLEKTVVRYHRGEVEGIERIPTGPVLYVGNHNGGLYSGDTWVFAAALMRAHGITAAPHGLAHDIVLKLPGLGDVLRRFGCVAANHGNGRRLLEAGRSVMVYPGGDLDSLRPFRARNTVVFGGRNGFIRMALAAGVPIVPVAAQGAHSTFIVIDDLQWLARGLGLDKRLRVKVFPLTFLLPWGLVLGFPPPYIPLPSKIRIEVLPPIRFSRTGEDAAADADYVAECAREVQQALQASVSRLAERPG